MRSNLKILGSNVTSCKRVIVDEHGARTLAFYAYLPDHTEIGPYSTRAQAEEDRRVTIAKMMEATGK